MVVLIQEVEGLAVDPARTRHGLKDSEACSKGNAELRHWQSSAFVGLKGSKNIRALFLDPMAGRHPKNARSEHRICNSRHPSIASCV